MLHVSWLSLHNRYGLARDLFLMSHAAEKVHDSSIKTRILYNRALAQLGCCAFRVGEFRTSLECLAELHQSNRLKELLAQGVSVNRWSDRDLEQEAADRQRQFPFHQHLNLDTLEATHLLSAMLVEVPNLALHGASNKRRVISKVFRRLFEHHQRQAFNGPPENTRDIVMAATRALRQGDWDQAHTFVRKLRMWDTYPQDTPTPASRDSLSTSSTPAASRSVLVQYVQSLFRHRLQEEALRTYLISYSVHFTSLSLSSLSEMFSLPAPLVHRLASKLMMNDQLTGAWDEPSQLIQMQPHHSNAKQKAALSFSDKALLFVDQNERLLESRQYAGDRGGGHGHGHGHGHGGHGGHHHRGGDNRHEGHEGGFKKNEERRRKPRY